ncbi:MAG TPA: hypothetical protein DHV28_14210 [Ignavibacteriales bacterium]|nr:hypothetical protein [Ignavibacteriales bacterium]
MIDWIVNVFSPCKNRLMNFYAHRLLIIPSSQWTRNCIVINTPCCYIT